VYEKASSVVSADVGAPRWLHRFIIGRKGQNIRKITQDLPKACSKNLILNLRNNSLLIESFRFRDEDENEYEI